MSSKRGGKRGRQGLDAATDSARIAGMLDAYTETAASTVSDSDKFKEGYKKKNKNKQRQQQHRKSESEEQPPEEPVEPQEAEEKPVAEEEEDEVIDSWEDIEAPAMPVPPKVKQEMKKQQKLQQQKAKQNKSPGKADDCSAEKTAGKNKKVEETGNKGKNQPTDISGKLNQLSLDEPQTNKSAEAQTKKSAEPQTNKSAEPKDQKAQKNKDETDQPTEGEQKAVKSEREAKKAAKAAAKAKAAEKKKAAASGEPAAAGGGGGGGGAVEPEKSGTEEQGEVKQQQEQKNKDEQKAERKAQFEQKQKEKVEETGDQAGGKSKAELKAERRAKQEAQRAAKAQAQSEKMKSTGADSKGETKGQTKQQRVPDDMQADRPDVEKKLAKSLASMQVPERTKAQRQVPLFSHLHQYEREVSATRSLPVTGGGNLHPAVLQLGTQFAEGEVTGSEGRCVALLQALSTLLSHHLDTLAGKDLDSSFDMSKELESVLKPNLTFIKQCRPLSISMGNGVKYLKKQISLLKRGVKWSEAKSRLEESVDSFIHENVELAAEQIARTAYDKIKDGDVILTYSYSSLIEKVLVDAFKQGKKFKVIVSDGRVRYEGRRLAANLANMGVQTTYVLLTAVSSVLPSVTKVFLGCHGVMANGCVMARVGTSQVALTAKSMGKPVLVCCQTFKFTERVQTDSFVYNELADPDDLVSTPNHKEELDDWRDHDSLFLLNLVYDVTPSCLVDAVITEISTIPVTSVPVVLRLKHTEGHIPS